jgi:hypothetical protein
VRCGATALLDEIASSLEAPRNDRKKEALRNDGDWVKALPARSLPPLVIARSFKRRGNLKHGEQTVQPPDPCLHSWQNRPRHYREDCPQRDPFWLPLRAPLPIRGVARQGRCHQVCNHLRVNHLRVSPRGQWQRRICHLYKSEGEVSVPVSVPPAALQKQSSYPGV